MLKSKNKIVFTGGSGRFGRVLQESKLNFKTLFPNKSELDITSLKSIEKYLKRVKPKILVHMAGLSRPMKIHDENPIKSINLNISGTANITMACAKYNIKLIYFSTLYVYPCKKGNYTEEDALLPFNNYGWSKLGGETSVHMYKNSLILRICMTEKPFVHKKAFADVKTNFIFHHEVAKMIPKILNKKGILNVGGKTQSIYNFAKKTNKNIRKKSGKNLFPLNPSMNISKLNKILKKKT